MIKNLFNKSHYSAFAIAAIFLLSFSAISLHAKDVDYKYRSPNFTQVAKKAIPAVVSIQVRSKGKLINEGHQGNDLESDDPFGMFNDDFFRHFFGKVPRPGNRGQFYQQPKVGQASGFIITPDGYILTNSHVVNDADEITVTMQSGREFSGTLVGEDPNTDIAVIKIEASNLPHLPLGNSDDLEVGQWVMAVGNPLGLQASVSAGVVSAKGRNNLQLARVEDFIQTDAAINKGNSGGPLLDLNGEVIGINTAIVSTSGTGGYMGIGFAIPSNMAEYIMQELIHNGSVSRGFVGITMQAIDQDLANAFGLDGIQGALVAEVTTDSPAEKSGVRQGDIITAVNGKKVENMAQLRNTVSLMKPGSNIVLSVSRDGKTLRIPMQTGKFPEASAVIASTNNKLGFDVENLTPELARKLGYKKEKGVIISKVDRGSPAEWAGLKKGAIVEAVNRKAVDNVDDFNEALKQTGEGKPVLLLIKQGETSRFISLKVS